MFFIFFLPFFCFSLSFIFLVISPPYSFAVTSFSYKKAGYKEAQIRRLDVLIGEEPFPAFAKIVSKNNMMGEARKLADSIFKHLPKQMFQIKIQVKSEGKIIASKTISAMKKDVTAKLYGGDITRKMKLKEKQKKGKKKMKNTGSVKVPQSVFLKVIKWFLRLLFYLHFLLVFLFETFVLVNV